MLLNRVILNHSVCKCMYYCLLASMKFSCYWCEKLFESVLCQLIVNGLLVKYLFVVSLIKYKPFEKLETFKEKYFSSD